MIIATRLRGRCEACRIAGTTIEIQTAAALYKPCRMNVCRTCWERVAKLAAVVANKGNEPVMTYDEVLRLGL